MLQDRRLAVYDPGITCVPVLARNAGGWAAMLAGNYWRRCATCTSTSSRCATATAGRAADKGRELPTNRIRRRRSQRREVPDAVRAVLAGDKVEWSPEAYDELVDALWLEPDMRIPPGEARSRALDYVHRWQRQQERHEVAIRRGENEERMMVDSACAFR